ncbi:aromatic acid/H+ symport family MFS transporter [Amycolatopsis rhabdoformis]|uniref:Aromatic acid/H+ symport family MFS transporter n=1 Tax=Amycolatopsis rhabdoformis TaxID=1448059 RepID=A0ABZ1IFZ3_9PSEU|nr:aromatic acid/H+ symport family MFS transporter [Amycolatopsis rhabdoformis]WSE33327.1 aromatic acid/H+ symport family MFS transporter [Amycolatopsis rhabdoformis]
MTVSSPIDPRARYARWVAPLCWTAVALEGFDLVVLGVVLPALLKVPSWGLDPNSASLISVVGLLGVAAGALAIGPVSDLFGRRGTMLLTVTSFSVFTLLCAVVDDPWWFGLLRFLAGLGLGGVLPTALALITEYARVGRGGSSTTVLMTGYHVGAVLTALLGILVVERYGWQWMFVIGAAPAVILVPLMVKFLPESAEFLKVRGTPAARKAKAAQEPRERNPIAILFRRGYGRATIAFWVTSFMGLLLVYGLNTWLPQIMREAGYELGAALALLLVLNVGAVIGLLIGGRVADRLGYRRSTIVWFTAAAVFLALLSIKLPGFSVYVGVLLAGIFTFSAQVLVYVYVARVYPASARGTALGAASGIGRFGAISGPLVTGFLLTAGIAYPWGFYLFAVVAAIGAVAIAVVNRDPAPDAPLEVVAKETPAARAE